MGMEELDKLYDMIERHEGLKLKPYKDTRGILTIGVGRNLDQVGISEDEARTMLQNDVEEKEVQLSKIDWFQNLNLARGDAIIDMAFNLGVAKLLTFEKMIAALVAKNYELAAQEMLSSDWAKQVGSRAVELAQMVRTGSY